MGSGGGDGVSDGLCWRLRQRTGGVGVGGLVSEYSDMFSYIDSSISCRLQKADSYISYDGLKLSLNCLATYMDLYTIECTIEPPFIWYIQKYMLIWKVCFYFSFVFPICSSKTKKRHVTRDLSMDKMLSYWNNFSSCDPFTYYDCALAPLHLCNSKLGALFLSIGRS